MRNSEIIGNKLVDVQVKELIDTLAKALSTTLRYVTGEVETKRLSDKLVQV